VTKTRLEAFSDGVIAIIHTLTISLVSFATAFAGESHWTETVPAASCTPPFRSGGSRTGCRRAIGSG